MTDGVVHDAGTFVGNVLADICDFKDGLLVGENKTSFLSLFLIGDIDASFTFAGEAEASFFLAGDTEASVPFDGDDATPNPGEAPSVRRATACGEAGDL